MTAGPLERYFMRLAQERYYASALEEPGRWLGQGAAQLGLHGTVEREHFHNLLAGVSPDGTQKLVQNAGKSDRQAGWDLTFSAPKSVSVFWATVPESVRAVVEEAHRYAVEQALAHLEKMAGITRRGKGGKIKERAALTFALFQHGSSRADDPQLHLHAVLPNVGLRRDGTAGALQSRDFFRLKMQLGALYQKALAAGLHSRLGLKMERAKTGYRIAGVPATLCQHFSKRRQTMEKSMQKRGEHGAVAAKEAALRTRSRKKNVPRAELFAAWQQEAAALGWTQADALRLIHPIQKQDLALESSETHRRGETAVAAEYEASDARAARGPVGKANEASPSQPLPSGAERTAPAVPKPVAPKELSSGAKQESAPVVPSKQHPARAEGKAGAAATPQNSAQSVQTGSEDYRDFEGPVQPAPKATRPKSAGPARESNRARERQGNKERSSSQARGQRAGPRDQDERQEARTKTKARGRKNGQRKTARGRKAQRTKAQASRPRRQSLRLKGPVRVEWRRLFPKAPSWSPARKWKAPRLVLDRPQARRPRPRQWGRVLWSKNLIVGEVRVQKRRLFPKAPHWSPARKLTLPVVRVVMNTPPPPRQQTIHRSY